MPYSCGYFFGMIDEELAVIHFGKYFYMDIGTKRKQMAGLGFGNKRFFGAIPKMNVGARYAIKTVGVD